jgi:hypothetical protein
MKADGETVAKQIEGFEALAADPAAVQLLEALLAQAAQIQQASQQAFAAGQAPQPLPPVTYDQLLAGAAQHADVLDHAVSTWIASRPTAEVLAAFEQAQG